VGDGKNEEILAWVTESNFQLKARLCHGRRETAQNGGGGTGYKDGVDLVQATLILKTHRSSEHRRPLCGGPYSSLVILLSPSAARWLSGQRRCGQYYCSRMSRLRLCLRDNWCLTPRLIRWHRSYTSCCAVGLNFAGDLLLTAPTSGRILMGRKERIFESWICDTDNLCL